MKTELRNITAAFLMAIGVFSISASENTLLASEIAKLSLVLELENEALVMEDRMLDTENFGPTELKTSDEMVRVSKIASGVSLNSASKISLSASEIAKFGLELELEKDMMVMEDWMLDIKNFNPAESSISASEVAALNLILELEKETMVVEDWMLNTENFNLAESKTSNETVIESPAEIPSNSASEITFSALEIAKLGLILELENEMMVLEDWMLDTENFNPAESKSNETMVSSCAKQF